MASLEWTLCPPLPAEEGPELRHYTMQPEMGFQASHAAQAIETWRARYVWDDAGEGDLWYAQRLWKETGEGCLPMDFSFALDGVSREVLFARQPRIERTSAWGGRLEVEFEEAL